MIMEAVLNRIREVANHTLPKGSRLLLYGSQARGTAGPGSDWDILILLDKPKIEQSDYDEIVFPFTYLESWIRCITVLRNCCAHHARIWNRRFALKPQLPNRLPLGWITPTQKPIKLYHQLCTLLYMEQTITPCMDLKNFLFKLFADYPNIDLRAMGFPQGWENEPLWRQQQACLHVVAPSRGAYIYIMPMYLPM